MLRPEHFQSDTLNRLSAPSDRSSSSSGKQSSGKQSSTLTEPSDIDALVESLMPQGISPNKQAVIERLITMWVAKSDMDVA